MCASFSRMKRSTAPDLPALFDLADTGPDFSFELEARKKGLWPVAGTDEAGRGPLAGPVVAAAVILDPDNIPKGLDDSKKLTKLKRERLFLQIMETSIVSVASSGPGLIDTMNILRASLDAMRRAVLGLETSPPSCWPTAATSHRVSPAKPRPSSRAIPAPSPSPPPRSSPK